MATTSKRRKSGGAALRPAAPTAAQPNDADVTVSALGSQPAHNETPATLGTPQVEAPSLGQPSPAPSQPHSQPAADAPAILTPAAERAVFMRRRWMALAGIAVVVVLAAFLALRLFAPNAPRPADTVAPPALGSDPPAQAAAAACSAIGGLPVFPGASCIEQKRDVDDGVNKLANTYVVSAPADEVRRFFEQAFPQAGWSVKDTDHDQDDQAWEYSVEQGGRELKIEVKAQPVTQGALTKFELSEE